MIDPSMKTAIEEAGHARTAGTGRIVRIIGAVVDVQFPAAVPGIYNALTVEADTPMGHVSTILEVESQQPGGIARCVAMTSTDGLQRGLTAVDTGEPMKMPVQARRPSAASGTCSASPSTASPCPRWRTTTPSIILRRISMSSPRRPRFSKPVSRPSTCSSLISAAVRRDCSAAPAWARPCSSRNSSTISLRSITALRSSRAWASARVRARISTSR